jgi:hypothetical protein
MAARASVVLLALVMLAWLGVMERNLRLQAEGVAALRTGSALRDPARTQADLRRARLLNPDTAPDVTRAVVYRAVGRPRQAIALLETVVRREPDNLAAWSVLRLSAAGNDPDAFRRSLSALRRLDPVNVPPR